MHSFSSVMTCVPRQWGIPQLMGNNHHSLRLQSHVRCSGRTIGCHFASPPWEPCSTVQVQPAGRLCSCSIRGLLSSRWQKLLQIGEVRYWIVMGGIPLFWVFFRPDQPIHCLDHCLFRLQACFNLDPMAWLVVWFECLGDLYLLLYSLLKKFDPPFVCWIMDLPGGQVDCSREC